MAENLPLEVVRTDTDAKADSGATVEDAALPILQEKARALTARLHWLPNTPSSRVFRDRARALRSSLRPVFALGSAGPQPSASSQAGSCEPRKTSRHYQPGRKPEQRAREHVERVVDADVDA